MLMEGLDNWLFFKTIWFQVLVSLLFLCFSCCLCYGMSFTNIVVIIIIYISLYEFIILLYTYL